MIAVTGGTGFVGKRLVDRLVRDNKRVVLLSRGAGAVAGTTNDVVQFEYRHWDASSGELPPLEGVERVIHLAAYLPQNYTDPSEAQACVQTNAIGTLALLQSAEKFGCSHVTMISSGNVYKQQANTVSESSLAYPDQRSSFYLGSKLLGEIWVRHYATRGLKTLVLRPSAIYGPRMNGGIVRLLVDRMRCGQRVSLQNDGRFSSDLVYVDDVVQACLIGSQQQVTGIINVGSGVTTSVKQLAHMVSDALGVSFTELVELQSEDASDVGFSALAVDRLASALELHPTCIEDGIRQMIAEEAS